MRSQETPALLKYLLCIRTATKFKIRLLTYRFKDLPKVRITLSTLQSWRINCSINSAEIFLYCKKILNFSVILV
jgi:hypothetical protein